MYKAIETGNGDSAVVYSQEGMSFVLDIGLRPRQAKALAQSMQVDYDSVTLEELEATFVL